VTHERRAQNMNFKLLPGQNSRKHKTGPGHNSNSSLSIPTMMYPTSAPTKGSTMECKDSPLPFLRYGVTREYPLKRCNKSGPLAGSVKKAHCCPAAGVTCNLTGETCILTNSDMQFSVELEKEGEMVDVWKNCVPWIEKENCLNKCTKPGVLDTCRLACMCTDTDTDTIIVDRGK